MSFVDIQDEEGVTYVTLNDGKANTLNTTSIAAMTAAARELERGRGGIVLTGTGRFFSAGLDLTEVLTLEASKLQEFAVRFEEMGAAWFGLPRPVVAAINGHCIAGGLIIALTADFRYAAKSELKLGLNEVALGISLPPIVYHLLEPACSPAEVPAVLLEAKIYGPEEAHRAGLVHRVCEPQDLLPEAAKLAAKMGAAPGPAYADAKAIIRRNAMKKIRSGTPADLQPFVASLADPAVRAHIQKTMKK